MIMLHTEAGQTHRMVGSGMFEIFVGGEPNKGETNTADPGF